MKTIIGIDPGCSGAVCVMRTDGILIQKLDATESDVAAFVRAHAGDAHAFIELVQASPRRNRETGEAFSMGAKSAFTFGQSYGFLRGMLIALGVPFEEVRPQKWQQFMGCMTKGDKKVSKAKAQQLFPEEKVTLKNADALLIAEYGRRVHYSQLAEAPA